MSAPDSDCFENGMMPLELEMRVDEEEEDDPDAVETKSDVDEPQDSDEEVQPLPVQVNITPLEEDVNFKPEDGEDTTTSLDESRLHEEVDIKEENKEDEDEVLQPPLAINIKEEKNEEEEDSVVENSSSSQYERSRRKRKVKSMPDFVDEDENSEEEILPQAAFVVVQGRADEQNPHGTAEENVSAKPAGKTGKRSKTTSKRVDTVYRCPNCSLCYTSPQYLAGHVRRGCRYRPSPIKNAYQCIVCGEGFNNYGDLYQHKRQKHDKIGPTIVDAVVATPQKSPSEQSCQCPDCPRSFSRFGYLLQHQKTHLRSLSDKSCDICGESFRDKTIAEKEQHISKKHPDVKPHRCDRCENVYCRLQNFVLHLQAHGGERVTKPLTCKV